MNEQIKQKIDEEALRMFPKSGGKKSFSAVNRSIFTSACYWYHNNIKESVNHQMLDALKRINDCSLSKQQREVMIENAILSASNQSEKESVDEKLVNCLKDFVFQCNRAEGKRSLIDLSTIETAIKLIKEFSASNQENNEGEKCDCTEEYVCGICFERKGYAVKDGKLELINPPKEK